MSFEQWWNVYWKNHFSVPIMNEAMKEIAKSAWDARLHCIGPNEDDEVAFEEDLTPILNTLYDPFKSQTYRTALIALACGVDHRVLLLKEGYVFDTAHGLADVQPFEFDGEGYGPGGAWVSFISKDGNLGLEAVTFKDITGMFAGAVAYNECGLIAYMPVSGHSDGGNVTIKGLA